MGFGNYLDGREKHQNEKIYTKTRQFFFWIKSFRSLPISNSVHNLVPELKQIE